MVNGFVHGTTKHTMQFRLHSINLTLQKVLCRITISRSELHEVNILIDQCMKQDQTGQADSMAQASAEEVTV
jgi:hypothetical protein